MKLEYIIGQSSITLRQWVRHMFPHISYDCLQQALRKGDIRINHAKVTPQYVVQVNDKCTIWDKLTLVEAQPVKIPDKFWKNIDLVEQNDDFWVIDKPYGVPSQGGHNIKVSIVDIMTTWMQAPAYIVHRLDRCTTGLMVVATNSYAARDLSKSLQNHKWYKLYTAKIDGPCKMKEGVLEGLVGGKPAVTKFRLVKNMSTYSIVQFNPITGRKHQIRQHAARFLHPVTGDELYGSTSDEKMNLRCCVLQFEFRRRLYKYELPSIV